MLSFQQCQIVEHDYASDMNVDRFMSDEYSQMLSVLYANAPQYTGLLNYTYDVTTNCYTIIGLKADKPRNGNCDDLSDHYPVLGYYEF
ncbi:unnamed protein product [Didymodactylos carnosus]|uniref:Uncharacterized protein n=1 Tax=Didymodactylos carnosus TaxID=1234261 RepID=A0A815ARY9_9BILA|nr:unnamed protein product [Didymodactylos carnosus]CAF4038689.1 unnamed protein product [Didymodactylos carnosus]